jgi:hypothetical protein
LEITFETGTTRFDEEWRTHYPRIRGLMTEDPVSEKVQSLVEEWKKHVDFFYNCTPEILLTLAQN